MYIDPALLFMGMDRKGHHHQQPQLLVYPLKVGNICLGKQVHLCYHFVISMVRYLAKEFPDVDRGFVEKWTPLGFFFISGYRSLLQIRFCLILG